MNSTCKSPRDLCELRAIVGSAYDDRNIAITGATGYIGSKIVQTLSQFRCTIIRISRDTDNLLPIEGIAAVRDLVADYGDIDFWHEILADVDLIFHLAGQTSAKNSEEDEKFDFTSNVTPMQSILFACREGNYSPTIIYSGTSTQCGIIDDIPADESVVDTPETFYDFHKLLAEQYLKYYCHKNIVSGVSLRLTNVYGPGPKCANDDRGILNLMVQNALAGNDLTTYDGGEFLRDYIYIDDVVSALLIAGLHIQNINGKHLLLGTGCGTTIRDALNTIVELVWKLTGVKVSVHDVDRDHPASRIDMRNFVADISMLKRFLTWKPSVSLYDGIIKTIRSNIG